MIHVEAVFEHGVLRPLKPLSLRERQRVMLIMPTPKAPVPRTPGKRHKIGSERMRLSTVASGWRSMAAASSALAAMPAPFTNEAHAKGVERALMVRVPQDPELPSAGWL